MPSSTVGLIGVGLVGMALAERFQAAGYAVVGYDIDPRRQEQLQELAGAAAATPDQVIRSCEIIFLSLPTSAVAVGILKSLQASLAGKTLIDTTTGEPVEMIEMGERLQSQGAHYLDATIAGSSAQVRTGEVIVMVGGEEPVVAQSRILLQTFARQVFHLGPWGSGARMKLVVNLVLGLSRAVLAEGLCFARQLEIDPRQALEVLQASPAYSRVMDLKGEKMLNAEFTPQARLAQHSKDVGIILATGKKIGAQLPLSTLHAQLLHGLIARGFGDLDNSAIINAFRSDPCLSDEVS